jgi:methyl-accepting chemotaxis protein
MNIMMKEHKAMRGFQFKSIKTQITAAVVTTVAVVCVGLAVISYLIATAGLKANMDSSMRQVVKQAANMVNARIGEYFTQLDTLADLELFQNIAANKTEIMALLKKEAAKSGHINMTLVDVNGNGLNTDGSIAQVAERDYFKQALQGQNVISSPMVSKRTGELYVIQAAPIKNKQNQVIGVLLLGRHGNGLSQIISEVTYGQSGKAFMIDQEGTAVAHYNQEKVINKDNAIKQAEKDPKLRQVAAIQKKMIKGATGIGEFTTDKGVTKYVAYCPVTGTKWSIALVTPKDEIFAMMYRMRTMSIIVSIIFLVIGGLVSYLVAYWISKPIQQSNVYLATLATGNLEQNVEQVLLARRDELGQLAHAVQSITDNQREKAAAAAQIAAGELNVKLEMKSETDVLTQNLNKMVVNIQQVTGDINMLAEAAVAGNLAVRADAGKHGGAYRKMVTGINDTLDAVVTPLNNAQAVLGKLAINDYSEAMPPEKYQGELRTLAEKINEVRTRLLSLLDVARKVSQGDTSSLETMKSIGKLSAEDQLTPAFVAMMQNVENVIREVDQLAAAGISGDLQARGNAEQFEGGYRRIINGFNQTLDAIIKPINETSTVLQEMAAGRLDVAVEGNYQGGYALLAQAVNHMVDSFNEVLGEFYNAAIQVTGSAQNVADSSQVISQAAAEQAATTEEITASITEIATQTKQNADNATRANNLAVSAQDQATAGNKQMERMLEAMTAINTSSASISKIIKVIDDIAFQTNILALNAAVEAARAGQYGKGFAVVAEEVRTLAARSATAAKETTALIESSIEKVDGGTKIANETAQSLVKIAEGIARTTALVGDIAIASNEQASGITQVNQGIDQIAQVTQTNTATAEQSAAASEELVSQAEILKGMIQKFKLKKSETHTAFVNENRRPEAKRLTAEQSKRTTTEANQQFLSIKEFDKY